MRRFEGKEGLRVKLRVRTGFSFPKKRRPDGEALSSRLDIFSEVLVAQAEVSTWSGGDSWPDLKRKVGAGGLDLVSMMMSVYQW